MPSNENKQYANGKLIDPTGQAVNQKSTNTGKKYPILLYAVWFFSPLPSSDFNIKVPNLTEKKIIEKYLLNKLLKWHLPIFQLSNSQIYLLKIQHCRFGEKRNRKTKQEKWKLNFYFTIWLFSDCVFARILLICNKNKATKKYIMWKIKNKYKILLFVLFECSNTMIVKSNLNELSCVAVLLFCRLLSYLSQMNFVTSKKWTVIHDEVACVSPQFSISNLSECRWFKNSNYFFLYFFSDWIFYSCSGILPCKTLLLLLKTLSLTKFTEKTTNKNKTKRHRRQRPLTCYLNVWLPPSNAWGRPKNKKQIQCDFQTFSFATFSISPPNEKLHHHLIVCERWMKCVINYNHKIYWLHLYMRQCMTKHNIIYLFTCRPNRPCNNIVYNRL